MAAWARAISCLDRSKTLTNDAFSTLLKDANGPAPVVAQRLRWYALAQRPRRHHGAIFDASFRVLIPAAVMSASRFSMADTAATGSATSAQLRMDAQERFELLAECVGECRVSQVAVRATLPRLLEGLMTCGALLPDAQPTAAALLNVMPEELGGPSNNRSADLSCVRHAIVTGYWEAALRIAAVTDVELPRVVEFTGRLVSRGSQHVGTGVATIDASAWANSLRVASHWLGRPTNREGRCDSIALRLAAGVLRAPEVGPETRTQAAAACVAHASRSVGAPDAQAAVAAAVRSCRSWEAGVACLKAWELGHAPPDAVAPLVRLMGDAGQWTLALTTFQQAASASASDSNVTRSMAPVSLATIFALGHSARWEAAAVIAADTLASARENSQKEVVLNTTITAMAHSNPLEALPVMDRAFAELRAISGDGTDGGSASYVASSRATAGQPERAIEVIETVPECTVTPLGVNAIRGAIDALDDVVVACLLSKRLVRAVAKRESTRRPDAVRGNMRRHGRPLRVLCIAACGHAEVVYRREDRQAVTEGKPGACVTSLPAEAAAEIAASFAHCHAHMASEGDFAFAVGIVLKDLLHPKVSQPEAVAVMVAAAVNGLSKRPDGGEYSTASVPRIARATGMPDTAIAQYLL